jgi:MFS family permease
MPGLEYAMDRDRLNFLFLNIGHFLDHFFILIFATVAALRLATEWNMTYAELIPYATPGFVAFGACAIPAGWLADKWSREGMMTIFFIGIGICSMLTALADTPLQIAASLFCIGVFGAIYHPVGLAMVVHGREKTGVPLAINGIFGNMGVASAALLTGYLIDAMDWRAAFVLPGILSVVIGIAYGLFVHSGRHARAAERASGAAAKKAAAGTMSIDRSTLMRVFAIIFFSTAIGGLIFQSTTFALPKVFDERLTDLASTATAVGSYAFIVFAAAAFAQLVVGYMVDRYSVRIVFAVVAGLQAVFFAVMVQLSGVAALLVSLGFMLVVFGQIPINDVLVGRITRSEWRSRVFALRYIVTFSVAATAVPMIAGIHSTWGFSMLFIVMAIAAAFIFVAVLMLPSTAAVTGTAPAE